MCNILERLISKPDTGTLNLKLSLAEAEISPSSPMLSKLMKTFAHLPSVKNERISGSVLMSMANEDARSPCNTDFASVKLDLVAASNTAKCHCSRLASLLNTFPISNIFCG